MPIPPIASIVPISAASAPLPIAGVNAATAASPTGATSAAGGSDFATMLGNGIDAMTAAQNTASNLAVQAATGQLVDPAQYTAAATQATLMTQLATTIQSKAVNAFNTIMGMQA